MADAESELASGADAGATAARDIKACSEDI